MCLCAGLFFFLICDASGVAVLVEKREKKKATPLRDTRKSLVPCSDIVWEGEPPRVCVCVN